MGRKMAKKITLFLYVKQNAGKTSDNVHIAFLKFVY